MTTLAIGAANGVEFIAHRGASYDAPENTVASMKLGFEQGADAGELDIHQTVDGKIVVLHDADTARVTGVTNQVAGTTAEALSRLEAGQWGKWRGKAYHEPIPELAKVLGIVPEGKRIFIEVKCGPEVLPELESVLGQSGLKEGQAVLIGFGYETMVLAKKRFPHTPVFWLVGADKDKKYPPVQELIVKTKAGGLDGLNLEKGFPIDRAFAEQVHQAGLQLYVWTVDEPEIAERLARAGVDGITTNRPRWLREAVAFRPGNS